MKFSGKVTGGRKLARQLRDLPKVERKMVTDAVGKNIEKVARTAKVVAPVATGETRDLIDTEIKSDGMTGIVFAGATRQEKDKAYSVELGRKRGLRGTTAPQPYIGTAWAFHRKRVAGAIKRAVRKAVKSVAARG